MAQPALGMQIKQLEQELGAALLHRHSRGVSATAAGKLLYRHAHKILDAVDQARHEVSTFKRNEALQLRLGLNPSMIEVMGSDLLTDAKIKLPHVKISLTEERSQVLLQALERRQLDIALVYNVSDRPDLVRTAMVEEDLLFLTKTKLGDGETISFTEVLKQELAIGGERSVVRAVVEAEAQRLSLDVQPAFEVHSVPSLNTLVRRGIASTIMPYALCLKDVNARRLSAARIVGPNLTRTLYIAHQRAHPPILDDESVMDHLVELVTSYQAKIQRFARLLGR